MIDLIEWAGCITGLLGASLLAMNNRYSGWGFVLFLLSNVAWIVFGLLSHTRHGGHAGWIHVNQFDGRMAVVNREWPKIKMRYRHSVEHLWNIV